MKTRDRPTSAQIIKLLELLDAVHVLVSAHVTDDNNHRFLIMTQSVNSVIQGKQRNLNQWLETISGMKRKVRELGKTGKLKENTVEMKMYQILQSCNLILEPDQVKKPLEKPVKDEKIIFSDEETQKLYDDVDPEDKIWLKALTGPWQSKNKQRQAATSKLTVDIDLTGDDADSDIEKHPLLKKTKNSDLEDDFFFPNLNFSNESSVQKRGIISESQLADGLAISKIKSDNVPVTLHVGKSSYPAPTSTITSRDNPDLPLLNSNCPPTSSIPSSQTPTITSNSFLQKIRDNV